MQGKACYGECYRELSIGNLRVAYGNPYSPNLDLFRGCLTEQECDDAWGRQSVEMSSIGFYQWV